MEERIYFLVTNTKILLAGIGDPSWLYFFDSEGVIIPHTYLGISY